MKVHADPNDKQMETVEKQDFDEENPKDDNYELSASEPKEADEGHTVQPIEHLADLFCWESNTMFHKILGVFIAAAQGVLLANVLQYQSTWNGWRLSLIGLPLTGVILFNAIWDDFLDSFATMISDAIRFKESEKSIPDFGQVLAFSLKFWEVFFITYVCFCSIIVSISQPDILNIALNCTALTIVFDLDEGVLKFLDLKLEISKNEMAKKKETDEEKFELVYERISAPLLRFSVIVFYAVFYLGAASFKNSSQK
jgi:hypothetical protein